MIKDVAVFKDFPFTRLVKLHKNGKEIKNTIRFITARPLTAQELSVAKNGEDVAGPFEAIAAVDNADAKGDDHDGDDDDEDDDSDDDDNDDDDSDDDEGDGEDDEEDDNDDDDTDDDNDDDDDDDGDLYHSRVSDSRGSLNVVAPGGPRRSQRTHRK